MKTADLAVRLDAFFHLERYPAEDFQEIIQFWREAGVPFEQYVTTRFIERHNGLMVENSEEIGRVFTLVFPSEEVLAEVERRAAGEPSLTFTHHPMDFETSGRGLVPVSERSLQLMREAGISLYSAHAPLDCHESVSTSRALARAIGVPAEGVFAGYMGGQAGVIGLIGPMTLEEFVERIRQACRVERVDVKDHNGTVGRVAVVAGGAAFPALMQEAVDAGCDTYLTGDFRVRHGGPWAEEHRPQFDAFVDDVPLNLVGGSHYGTEALVLKDDMIEWFRALGLAAEFVPQSEPWR